MVKDAVVWQDEPFSYAWLLVAVGRWTDFLRDRALAPGTVVSLEASREIITIMKRQQDRNGIPRKMTGLEVANKTGVLDHLRSDVGSDPRHPELCARCVVNVEGPGEERKFA